MRRALADANLAGPPHRAGGAEAAAAVRTALPAFTLADAGTRAAVEADVVIGTLTTIPSASIRSAHPILAVGYTLAQSVHSTGVGWVASTAIVPADGIGTALQTGAVGYTALGDTGTIGIAALSGGTFSTAQS